MCGIFAYVNYMVKRNTKEIMELLINGLARLEYRGYDSAGVCVSSKGAPTIVRKTGNVAALRSCAIDENAGNVAFDEETSEHCGTAHTRWATHGAPCDRNAHPQACKENEFVLVHNGIMTNFSEMKAFLKEKGFVFNSDTDTEVIAALAKYLYDARKGDITFPQLVMEVMDMTEGAYAMVFISKHFPNELVGCKKGSPMIVGVKSAVAESTHVGDSQTDETLPVEIFISSDSTGLAEHTNKVVFLDDDDLIHYHGGALKFFNKARNEDFKKLRAELRQTNQLDVALESLTKGGFAHFMLKEINEQPITIMNSMRGRMNFETGHAVLGGFIGKQEILRTARRLMFISCGTSLNACTAIRPLFDELARIPVCTENASDFLDRRPVIFRDDVCIFVSQSGETADTLRALEYCKEKGAVLVGFTNTVGSSISRMSDFGAHLNCGVEVGVASTKAYTSQIVTMTLLALMLAEDSVSLAERRRSIVSALSELSNVVAATLKKVDEKVKSIAANLVAAKSVIVLGRGYQLATCFEAALKIKELTYVHTEGINSGELKHGPLALIDENIPVIIVCTKDSLIDRARSAMQQVRARKGRPIAIISEPDPEIESLAEEVIMVPPTLDCLQSVVNIVPMQLLAYYLAVARGNNVDCPRNLAKSVTTQ